MAYLFYITSDLAVDGRATQKGQGISTYGTELVPHQLPGLITGMVIISGNLLNPLANNVCLNNAMFCCFRWKWICRFSKRCDGLWQVGVSYSLWKLFHWRNASWKGPRKEFDPSSSKKILSEPLYTTDSFYLGISYECERKIAPIMIIIYSYVYSYIITKWGYNKQQKYAKYDP